MTANRATLYFIGYTIVFVWFFGVALDGLESMRYMWLVWSFNLILTALLVRGIARYLLKHYRALKPNIRH